MQEDFVACVVALRRPGALAQMGDTARFGGVDSPNEGKFVVARFLLSTAGMNPEANEKDIDQLNSMLRGELSAVETYEQCIEKMDDVSMKQQLATLRSSHVTRATKLKSRIRAMGGEPEKSPGAWGTFAKLVEGGAKVFGKKAAISAIGKGEDHGKKDYASVDGLTPEVRHFVQTELMPEQKRTHDALSAIQSQM